MCLIIKCITGTIRWMAPEICTPPPELSSFESDVWSFGCIVLETTSGQEPWIDQYSTDTILFQALQNKQNAPVFAQICADQSGPSAICHLLIRCCCWSKVSRPRFIDILHQLEAAPNRSTFTKRATDRMSIDEPISEDAMYSNKNYTEKSDLPNFNGHKYESMRSIRSIPSPRLDDNYQQIEPKLNKHQGRLTGETYTSRGSASGRPIYEGIRGGRYYLTASGTKVYLHK